MVAQVKRGNQAAADAADRRASTACDPVQAPVPF